jgi:hypothetical protein
MINCYVPQKLIRTYDKWINVGAHAHVNLSLITEYLLILIFFFFFFFRTAVIFFPYTLQKRQGRFQINLKRNIYIRAACIHVGVIMEP